MQQNSLQDIVHKAEQDIANSSDLTALEQCRVYLLGKKGILTEYLKTLGQLPATERPLVGQQVNSAKEHIQQAIRLREIILKQNLVATKLAAEALDISLAGRTLEKGSLHPITQTIMDLQDIFNSMGFLMMEGPEIEDEYHNFTALNIPEWHPARAMQDTFFFADGSLLRTQTSPVQIRAMKTRSLPLRIVAMGRVYRRDFDLTHTPMFHQMECLLIDKKVTFANLKMILQQFLAAFFERQISLRLRPNYFPFTEPSAEVDIECIKCVGKGCRICKQSGWLEVLGSGMVHPNVLKKANIDPTVYKGFAFGAGIDRLAMLKYGISDLRTLFENDLRFLKQF